MSVSSAGAWPAHESSIFLQKKVTGSDPVAFSICPGLFNDARLRFKRFAGGGAAGESPSDAFALPPPKEGTAGISPPGAFCGIPSGAPSGAPPGNPSVPPAGAPSGLSPVPAGGGSRQEHQCQNNSRYLFDHFIKSPSISCRDHDISVTLYEPETADVVTA